MLLQKLWPLLLFVHTLACFAFPEFVSSRGSERQSSLFTREKQIWRLAIHESKFSTVLHSTNQIRCAETAIPEPIATPNPFLERFDQDTKLSISFIVGTDGRVHSPFILDSTGLTEAGNALSAVRSWRYRPATCNGVPTEAEARVEFSTR
ncbi:MAG TPA: energy transducer TonB [Terriglobales bacterium]|nr:energy transducer TonB [Terriglobales bacterium]